MKFITFHHSLQIFAHSIFQPTVRTFEKAAISRSDYSTPLSETSSPDSSSQVQGSPKVSSGAEESTEDLKKGETPPIDVSLQQQHSALSHSHSIQQKKRGHDRKAARSQSSISSCSSTSSSEYLSANEMTKDGTPPFLTFFFSFSTNIDQNSFSKSPLLSSGTSPTSFSPGSAADVIIIQ